MKKLLLALIFVSVQAQSQTTEEYMGALTNSFKPKSTSNLTCGKYMSEVQVRNQAVTLSKSSGNSEFDREAIRAAKKALDESYVGWIRFPMSTGVASRCPTGISPDGLFEW